MAGVAQDRARIERVLARSGVVKICGLREPAHAAAAAAAGADLIGFIFAPAQRRVTAILARACVEAARNAAGGEEVAAVGVFVDATAPEMIAIIAEAGLDAVQLHGAEPPDLLQALPVPAIKVLKPQPPETSDTVLSVMDRFGAAASPPIAFIIEGHSERGAGGTGTRADWSLAANVAARRPILLGGGLDAGNVAVAIERVRPVGVDVSSGVEKDGVKDPARIETFVSAAREAFARGGCRLPR
jgi:phosphoribosylanthranilate isomerase